jgi:uncharacterized protein
MDPAALVLSITSKAECVPGRTSLQKLSYFVNNSVAGGIAFKPHFYGPYSEEVASATDVEVAANLLHEEIARGLYFRSGKEREWTRHSYSLTPDGQTYLNWLMTKSGLPFDTIGQVVQKLKGETALDPDQLSRLAKVRFIIDSNELTKPHPVEITTAARTFGWSIVPSIARKSLITLERLQL